MPNVFDNPGCWSFVLNQVCIDADLPFEFASGCFISKATEEQRNKIKEVISKYAPHGFTSPEEFYEGSAVVTSTESGWSTSIEPLSESEWRYYVVATPDNGSTNFNIHLASIISNAVLEISGLVFYVGSKSGYSFRSGILQNHFESTPSPAMRIGMTELQELANTYKAVKEFNENMYPEVLRAMRMYDALSLLGISTFHVLGLFAIIEMLITHNPKLEDRGDSITHQMQSKIPLLSNRFERPLDYSNFFGAEPEKKIWSALYAYRSAIAHGGSPDFQSRDLKVLKSSRNADLFLQGVLKALLRQALQEPQLYKDLRSC